MAQKVTFTGLQALKPRDKPYTATDGGGRFVEVLPTGTMVLALPVPASRQAEQSHALDYRNAGDPKTHIQMSLDNARDEHRNARVRVPFW